MTDPSYYQFPTTATGPSDKPFEITPHDTNPLEKLPRALYIGGAGNVKLRGLNGTADVTMIAPAGTVLLVRAQYIRSTGTTATGIVGLL